MIGQCSAPRPELGLVRGLLETVDCNIREGVQGGYNAFFGPGSTLTAVITVLLTIYVALLGLRLLTGRTDLRVGDLPLIAIKLGAVVMLTTSWASYQSLVFNLLFDGPAEIANSLLVSMPMPQTVGPTDVFARLQSSFDQLTQSASAMALVSDEPGQGPNAAGAGLKAGSLVLQAAPGTDPASLKGLTPVIQMRSALQGGPAFGATALWVSAIVLLVSTLGLLILAKLMLGLLLAIGPLFVGLLLFDTTKGFFEGWLKTSLGFALVPIATIVFMTALLASLEPSLQNLALARSENRYAIEPILTVLVIILTFTAVFGSVIGLCTRLVAGFRLPTPPMRELDAYNPQSVINNTGGVLGGEQANGNERAARLVAQLEQAPLSQGPAMDRRSVRVAEATLAMARGNEKSDATSNAMQTTLDRRTELTSGSGLERAQTDNSRRLGQTGRKRSKPVLDARSVNMSSKTKPVQISSVQTARAFTGISP